MSRTRFLVVLGLVLFVIGLSIAIAGPFGFFGRGAGGCSNGSCSLPEPENVVTPTPEPIPSNVILDVKKNKSQEVVNINNNILDGSCNCKNCKCKECVCDHCKCEDCPGKNKVVVKHDVLTAPSIENTVTPPAQVKTVQQDECEQQVQQYEYYERPRLFRRIFGRR